MLEHRLVRVRIEVHGKPVVAEVRVAAHGHVDRCPRRWAMGLQARDQLQRRHVAGPAVRRGRRRAHMVGHTGNFDAARRAIEVVDECVGRITARLLELDAHILITADHGNAEQMTDPVTGQAHTAHTSELVPFIYVGRDATIKDKGRLCDIAPTMLTLMGQSVPSEMTGRCIIDLKE